MDGSMDGHQVVCVCLGGVSDPLQLHYPRPESLDSDKVAADTNGLPRRTRYRTKLGWFFWVCMVHCDDTTKGEWQIWFSKPDTETNWVAYFGSARFTVTIRRNLGSTATRPAVQPADIGWPT